MHRLADTAFAVVSHFDTVNDDFNVMGLVPVEHHAELDFAQLSVHTNPGETCLTDMLEEFAVMALPTSDAGGKDADSFPFEVIENQVCNLFLGVTDHLFSGIIGVGFANAGIQQSEEVVDLSDGPHGRSGVFVYGFLLNGDDRAQAGDLIDVWAFHIADELPGVGRETLHIAPLPFGIDGVEGQGRLTAATDAGDDHQGITWYG